MRGKDFLLFWKLMNPEIRLSIFEFKAFFPFIMWRFKSIQIAYVIRMTNSEITIPIVVIKPNLEMGKTFEKQKLKKPIAVVIEVKATGFPILFIWNLKYSSLDFLVSPLSLTKCIKSEIQTIKSIAGIIIITSSIPPKSTWDIIKLIEMLNKTLVITIQTNFKFLEKNQSTRQHKKALKKVI